MTNQENMTRSPIHNSHADLFTFLVFDEKTGHRDMTIYQAFVDGLRSQELSNYLNFKYFREANTLFSDYLYRIDAGVQNITYLSNYSLKANNGTTAAIEHSTFIAEASGLQNLQFDNLDIKNEYYITLSCLFKNESYLQRISQEIKRQIAGQIKHNPELVYFTGDSAFQQINPMQPFYISNTHQLIIVFNEYTIAPGYMGTREFVIPTAAISDLLAHSTYIR